MLLNFSARSTIIIHEIYEIRWLCNDNNFLLKVLDDNDLQMNSHYHNFYRIF